MSQSVKSFYPWRSTLVNTYRFFLQVAVVLSIIQLVDPQKLQYANHHSSDHDRPPAWWLNPALDEPEDNDINSARSWPRSTFKFKTPNFEFSYGTFRLNDKHRRTNKPSLGSLKDMINKAIDAKINKLFDLKFFLGNKGLQIPEAMIPLDCEHALICDDRSHYPTDIIERIMKHFQDLQMLAPAYEPPVADRSSSGDEKNLCDSTEKKYASTFVRMNLSAPWYTVVNTPNFEQELSISNCRNIDESCSKDIGASEANYSTLCRQQYAQQLMIVFKPNTDKPIAEFFRVPSGCCCHKEKISENYEVERMSRSYHRGGRWSN